MAFQINNHFSLISDENEIKVLSEKFKTNGFHCSPYRDLNHIWDSYKLLETHDLDKIQKCNFVSRCNLGKRCHLFLIKDNNLNCAYFLNNGYFYKCEELESYFETSLFYGTLFDGELVFADDHIVFIVFDVLALGGIINEKIEYIQQSPPFPVSVDIKPFSLEYRIDFADILFENSEFFFGNILESPFFKFTVNIYYHIAEFDNLVQKEIPNDTMFPYSDTVMFQHSNFNMIRYIYHIQRISFPETKYRKGTRKLTVFKDKYPGIWTVYDKDIQEHLYVPSFVCYQRLRQIANHTQIPCIYNETQKMWMPVFDV